jgi:hypothetical protein
MRLAGAHPPRAVRQRSRRQGTKPWRPEEAAVAAGNRRDVERALLRPASLDGPAVARLQRSAGNQAVARLLQQPVVQRFDIASLAEGLGTLLKIGPSAYGILTDVAAGVSPSHAVVRQLLKAGLSEEDATDLLFYARHPAQIGHKLGPGDEKLIAEWRSIRSSVVRPLVKKVEAERRSAGEPPASFAGFTIDLSHAEKFDGEVLVDEPGWERTKGECATGVQYVFYKGGAPLGKTSTWRQGAKVRGNNIPPGTAIASFRNGKYANDHAAILIKETAQGLEVWDQWKGKAWGKRVLRFAKGEDRSNNGNMFYVIEH